jgi:hypothetical protein
MDHERDGAATADAPAIAADAPDAPNVTADAPEAPTTSDGSGADEPIEVAGSVAVAERRLISEDWAATILGLVLLGLVLAGVIGKGLVP